MDPELLTEKEFKSLFRMSRANFQLLADVLMPMVKKNIPQRSRVSLPIEPMVRIAMALRYFAGGKFFLHLFFNFLIIMESL